jgi:hypothetical protein
LSETVKKNQQRQALEQQSHILLKKLRGLWKHIHPRLSLSLQSLPRPLNGSLMAIVTMACDPAFPQNVLLVWLSKYHHLRNLGNVENGVVLPRPLLVNYNNRKQRSEIPLASTSM